MKVVEQAKMESSLWQCSIMAKEEDMLILMLRTISSNNSKSGSTGRVMKLEEWREEMKVMFGKRLEVLEESRLLKKSGKLTKRGWRMVGGRTMRF